MALELSNTKWCLGFTVGMGQPPRLRKLRAQDLEGLKDEIDLSKKRFGLPTEAPVLSCYEAGRDGFWLHRFLSAQGVLSQVVDSTSIEVNRRKRQVKTDRFAVDKLLTILMRANASGTYHPGIPFRDIVTGSLELVLSTKRDVEYVDPDTGISIYLGDGSDVEDMAFSLDGKLLAIACWSEIQLRSTKSGEILAYIEFPENRSSNIAISFDKRLLAASSFEGNIHILGINKSVCLEFGYFRGRTPLNPALTMTRLWRMISGAF